MTWLSQVAQKVARTGMTIHVSSSSYGTNSAYHTQHRHNTHTHTVLPAPHTRMHACTHARTRARTRARTHAHTLTHPHTGRAVHCDTPGAANTHTHTHTPTHIHTHTGRAVHWVTPLGLPVTQPYYTESTKTVRTVLQSVRVRDSRSWQRVLECV